MSNFEAKHPRAKDGKFTEKLRKESGIELSCAPDDWSDFGRKKEDSPVKPDIPADLGKAGDKIIKQMEEDAAKMDPGLFGVKDYLEDHGLYGPKGWLKKTGVTDVMKDYLGTGTGMGNCARFSKLDSKGAEELLKVLPTSALLDRQNDAPSLKTLLSACAANPGKITLSGYTIDDSRWDERVSIDTIHISDPEAVEGANISRQQARDKWNEYQEKLGLDAGEAPDEVYSNEGGNGKPAGWTFWWD